MIRAKEVKVLDLSINGQELGLFQIESEWNGLKKLRSLKNNEILIAMPTEPEGGMANCFDGLFAGITGIPLQKEMHIISATRNLAAMINKNISGEKK